MEGARLGGERLLGHFPNINLVRLGGDGEALAVGAEGDIGIEARRSWSFPVKDRQDCSGWVSHNCALFFAVMPCSASSKITTSLPSGLQDQARRGFMLAWLGNGRS